MLKILLPHIGLNVLLLSYIAFGAFIFIRLEAESELNSRKMKLRKVLDLYELVINEASSLCHGDYNSTYSREMVERSLWPILVNLSWAHETDDRFAANEQSWIVQEEQMVPRWSFAAAVLYALTVITSTGYDHVTPNTDGGRIFTVFFGLLGIPLMFITAADIGKFLSEISYSKVLQMASWISSIYSLVRSYIKTNNDDEDSIDLKEKEKKRNVGIVDDDDGDRYCVLGSLLFNAFEKGPIWSFMHGLFFSFNTITTIGLGNIYLVVTYVIVGLAVITASLDLCSSTLKRAFTRLHYFGRKIKGARRGFAVIGDDLFEWMKYITAMKKTGPNRERITLEDIRRLLEVQDRLRQPYVPCNVQFFRWIEDAVNINSLIIFTLFIFKT
ncbi:unnamed protein product [Enterobius vermicularis]|uniref:Potassium channel domain-containing protein n=1 Tax=Enterobius vermicularis TaxID=51028 RepID=A0A3P6H3J7_ENTVE|nr:unnamed protein product [Enterobius vermicularis]